VRIRKERPRRGYNSAAQELYLHAFRRKVPCHIMSRETATVALGGMRVVLKAGLQRGEEPGDLVYVLG
jgi:hypothetical protein